MDALLYRLHAQGRGDDFAALRMAGEPRLTLSVNARARMPIRAAH